MREWERGIDERERGRNERDERENFYVVSIYSYIFTVSATNAVSAHYPMTSIKTTMALLSKFDFPNR